MNRRTLVLAIAFLVTALLVTGCDSAMGRAASTPTVVPLAVAKAKDTPTIAPTPTLLKAPTATLVPPEPTALRQAQDTATPTPLTAPVSSGVEGKVTADGLNVRTGPGTAYPIVGGLSLGDVREVVGRNAAGDWLQIHYNGRGEFNGQGGWIAAAYVDLVEDGEWRMEAVTEVSAPPTPTAAVESATIAAQAAPMPTPELTDKLVFQTSNGGDIYVINADGTGLRRLTDGMEPAWSPDGTKVAFARWRDPRGIYVIDEDGSNETLVFGWVPASGAARLGGVANRGTICHRLAERFVPGSASET